MSALASTPRATMRLQFNKDFRFSHAVPLVPYLARLGISHLYSSPILAAQPGSMHGYDVTDTSLINPELGGETEFRQLVAALREHGLGLIVDIVPNHMAASSANPFWFDVLKHGRASRYAAFYDVDWNSRDPSLHDKVLAPFLGKAYGEALRDGELKRARKGSEPVIAYYESVFPIDPATSHDEPDESFDPATEQGRAKLNELLEKQHYRLAWWGTAADEINWRRFFDINGLVALRIEDPEVFEATHQTLFRLYAEGSIDGFRIDHVDGLSDPPGYCRRLRTRLRELEAQRPASVPAGPAYIVVEKILGAGEAMPTDWNVDGTSGYDFMDAVSAVQHDASARPALEAFWSEVSGRPGDFEVEEIGARQEMLGWNFNGQLEALAVSFHNIARADVATRDITLASIRRGLIALLAQFRVYRMYVTDGTRSASDEAAFQRALTHARQASPSVLHGTLDQLNAWLGGAEPPPQLREQIRIARTRFHQLSAPVAAKAVEDTAFYRYGRLLSRNDVGFDAALLGIDPPEFHALSAARAKSFPSALLTTATHDHKRGEDVRSRLAILSEIPEEWMRAAREWREMNHTLRASSGSSPISPGDELMLYQMIVGAWPMELDPGQQDGREEYRDRISRWFEKAQREAKLRTNWTTPDTDYEQSSQEFLRSLFQPEHPFLAASHRFARRISAAGAVNGLAQMVLRLTTPGVPDCFQGTEYWDFSLVDPDNRRPVDFEARAASLAGEPDPVGLARNWRDGRVKQAVMAKVLNERAARPELFTRGAYLPLQVTGPRARHVLAFLRTAGSGAALVVVPRLPTALLNGEDSILVSPDTWDGTSIELPASHARRQFSELLSGRTVTAGDRGLRVSELLAAFPLAVASVRG